MTGNVTAVFGAVVDVEFQGAGGLPKIYEVLKAKTRLGREITLEVMEHLGVHMVRCIAISSTIDLQRGAEAQSAGHVIMVPVGQSTFNRVLNVLGEPIDGQGPVKSEEFRPIRLAEKRLYLNPEEEEKRSFEILETGLKFVDLLFPFVKGSKNGILGGAALGKSMLTLELIHNVVVKHQGSCIFTGVGERVREGNELYYDLKEAGIFGKVALVYGQMNESPGARFEVALTGITMAKYMQENDQNVLFFADSVYRFAQAGMEISTLLGHIPSETGYQPTLSSEMSEFHERIRSEKKGSITAVEAVYVPADDLTDPAVVAIFSYLDSILVLSRERVQQGLYPAIDPLASSSANLDPDIVGQKHYAIAQEVLKIFSKLEELRHIVAVVGLEELSLADRTLFNRGLKLQNFLTQPFFVAQTHTGRPGQYVPLEKTLEGCQQILEGRLDKVTEDKFYMIGAIEKDKL